MIEVIKVPVMVHKPCVLDTETSNPIFEGQEVIIKYRHKAGWIFHEDAKVHKFDENSIVLIKYGAYTSIDYSSIISITKKEEKEDE